MSDVFHWADYLTAFHQAAEQHDFLPKHLTELATGPLLTWERAGNGPHIYLSAGIHGDEPAGPMALLDLMRGGFFTTDYQWSLCPALNPTGLAAATRENSSGMDLNRDYWLRVTPEVLAHVAWIDALTTPDLAISLHEDWETSGFYFYEINLRDDSPERAHHILAGVSPWFLPEAGPMIDGHDVRENGWIYHAAEPDLPEGWPEAIYLAKKGCPLSFTFETPSHAPLQSRVAAHVAAVKAAVHQMISPL